MMAPDSTLPGPQGRSELPGAGTTLHVNGLGGTYGSRRVFAGVEFGLQAGDALVIVGQNGAGKSTLLRTLAGIIRPAAGSIALAAKRHDGLLEQVVVSLHQGASDALCRHVGLVSPELELYDELTAIENLAFFARVRGLCCTRSQLLESLSLAKLDRRAEDRMGAFSSGMKQRLRLLFAIQHRPALLLLDEPGSNLDAPGRELVASIVEQQLRMGIAVIATNDPEEVRLGQQILTLKGSAAGEGL